MPYKVGKYPGVLEKMRTLTDLASLAGIRRSYLDALRTVAEHLENDPLKWGDPIYRVPHQSGIVCHALVEPIVVHYSVHESAKVVLIIDIKPMFEWPIRPRTPENAMPNSRRFLSRRWLPGAAALLFGVLMLHPYPRQSLFGLTIRGKRKRGFV